MASDPITSETKELERALRELSPSALDGDFLARLEAAADNQLIALTEAELRFERNLRDHQASALAPDFLKDLEKIVADVPFPKDEKIVLFPKTAPLIRPGDRKKNRPIWAAAAAVALIGAATALLVPGTSPSPAGPVAKQTTPSYSTSPSSFTPYVVNTGFSDAKDEGVSWHQSGTPHRVLKVTYIDKVTLRNGEGRTITVEQPRVEYIYVPEKMD